MGRLSAWPCALMTVVGLAVAAAPQLSRAAPKGGDDILDELNTAPTKEPPTPKSQGQAPKTVEAAPVAKPSAPSATKATAAPAASTEANQASSAAAFDRVKAVPRKSVLKAHRFELAATPGLSINDAYFQHLALGASALFYFQDTLGFGVGADYLYANARTDNLEVVRRGEVAIPAVFEAPELLAYAGFYWTPLYGKVSLFDSLIGHFELYGSIGFGAAATRGRQALPSATWAIGERFFLSDFVAVRVEVRDHLFLDTQLVGDVKQSDVQNYLMLTAGLSIFFPFSFEYTTL